MVTGPPPKPTELKRMLGNPGKRALPDPRGVVALAGVRPGEVPEPSRPLGEVGAALWERVWTSGAVWLAKVPDSETVLMLCEQMDERARLREMVLKYGDRFDRVGLRALEAQIYRALSILGFTPSDRARLGVAEVRVESALDRLRRERAAEDAARVPGVIDVDEFNYDDDDDEDDGGQG